MRTGLFVFLLFFGWSAGTAQNREVTDSNVFYSIWESVKDNRITHKFFKHGQVLPIVREYTAYPDFEVNIIGKSFEGRDIPLVKIGRGDKNILLWTQMHGDEPTATMAILDIMRFFAQKDTLDLWKSDILSRLSIYIIPMLNPDGAEVYKRRNALDIDLNRDALRLESPESVLLKHVRDSLQPVFGFNLHDQSIYYTAGLTPEPAAISFLAPAYNEEKDLNDIRANAMRLIVQLNRILQGYIPGKIGKFNDTFEPRAFGDNIQKWGTSTVLIESGGFPGDVHKQYNRHLHFVILLAAFESIANKYYLYEGLYEYEDIPFNMRRAHDLIIRNLRYPFKDSIPLIDLAFQRSEILYNQYRDFYYRSAIADMGDLSTIPGFEELDAGEAMYIPGKLLKGDWKKVLHMSIAEILESGYTHVLVKNIPTEDKRKNLPIQFVLHERNVQNDPAMNKNPGFYLRKDGQITHWVSNGFLYHYPSDLNDWHKVKIKDLY